MAKGDFTYEVRKLPMDPVGIEDYVVRTSDGGVAGTVAAILEREGGERLLVVESGAPPAPVQRAVRWPLVERVDHDALAVWLDLDEQGYEREALELDPERAVEQGEGDAEARRLSSPPDDLIPNAITESRGPVDRPTWAKLVAVVALFGFSLLVATVVVTFTRDNTWALLFLLPAALAAVAAVLGLRAYRAPYESQGARKP